MQSPVCGVRNAEFDANAAASTGENSNVCRTNKMYDNTIKNIKRIAGPLLHDQSVRK